MAHRSRSRDGSTGLFCQASTRGERLVDLDTSMSAMDSDAFSRRAPCRMGALSMKTGSSLARSGGGCAPGVSRGCTALAGDEHGARRVTDLARDRGGDPPSSRASQLGHALEAVSRRTPRRARALKATISALKRPSSMARAARRWLSRANASMSSGLMSSARR